MNTSITYAGISSMGWVVRNRKIKWIEGYDRTVFQRADAVDSYMWEQQWNPKYLYIYMDTHTHI